MAVYHGEQLVLGFGEAPASPTQRLQQCLTDTLQALKTFAGTLTPRERDILQLGLVASHLEESAAHGDWKRAEAHAEALVKVLERLGPGTGTGT
jgi:hypothetical protein